MEKLVDVTKINADIGLGKLPFGFNKMQLKEKRNQLNGLGPPIKTTKEWQRVWTHYKANLKRKLAVNKRKFQATGGGPSSEISLSLLEQSTVEFVSIQTQVNTNDTTMGLENPEDSDGAESTFISEKLSPTVDSTVKQLPKNCRSSKNKLQDERLQVLKIKQKINRRS